MDTTSKMPEDLTEAHISGEHADPAMLRRHVLDVSNTQYESGTGRFPVKATEGDDVVALVERQRGEVVVAPHDAGRVENRKLESLSPGQTPAEVAELHQATLAAAGTETAAADDVPWSDETDDPLKPPAGL